MIALAGEPASARAGRASDPEGSGSRAPAVSRAGAILELLATEPTVASSPTVLARRLGLPKSSISNICTALAGAGLLERIGSEFVLGRKLAELGGAYLASIDQIQEFYAASNELEVAAQDTVELAVLEGLEVVSIARHGGRQVIRLVSDIGGRLPATCAAGGKAALATLAPDDLEQRLREGPGLVRLTPNSHGTVDQLLADLERVRERGYAIDDEETFEGILGLGIEVPGRSPGGAPCAASVTLLKASVTESRRQALVADLRRLRSLLSNPLQTSAVSSASTATQPGR